MPYLQKVTITFNTHNGNKDGGTILHVFVKNRSNTSSTPEGATDFVSNKLSYLSHETTPWDTNPYLAFAENLVAGTEFPDPSSTTFNIPLRSAPIPLEEIILPVVNIHILPDGEDQWIFDYTITFLFDDGRSFPAFSNTNGMPGIVLDQDRRNYSGICIENQFHSPPPIHKPETDAVLTRVTLTFSTHDDGKNDNTQLNVHIVNRLSASTSQDQDIAIGLDLLHAQEFPAPSSKTIEFSQTALPLASNSIRLQDIVLPVVYIIIVPSDEDRWIFDYQVAYTFSNGQTFSSRTSGIILNQDAPKYMGVYQGSPFPTVTPPGKPQPNVADLSIQRKLISLSFLQKKLEEFINSRQGVNSQDPPIRRLRLHNVGDFGRSTLPESYYDLQSLVANPPPPGVLSPPGFKEATTYNSNPTSIGQQYNVRGLGDLYLNDINSLTITANVDATQSTPLTVEVSFDCSGPQETLTVKDTAHLVRMNFLSFSVRIKLTLTLFNGGGQLTQIGGNKTASTPFVTPDGWVYFRGTDDRLLKVFNDGSQGTQIGTNTTKSTPFVTADGWVYFQGTDHNQLWKVFNDGGQLTQIGTNTTKSTPFVTPDEWVYFQGTDDRLLKVFNDGSQLTQIGGNKTASTPFVTADGWVYFRGTDDRLLKVFNDGGQGTQIGTNTTKSTPFVTLDGWVYFQGTDDRLLKVFNDGNQLTQIGDNKTASTPFVTADGWVYFRGTDDKLWKIFNDGSLQMQIGTNTTKSAPFVTADGWVYFQGTDHDQLWKADTTTMIDLLGWVPGITDHDDDRISDYIHVSVVTTNKTDLGGAFQKAVRKKIFDTLNDRDPIDGKTLRETLNSTVSSWLLGGVLDASIGYVVQDVTINGDNLEITYTRPQKIFEPPIPAGWPSGTDFSLGNLANIDHIVVLTMENRSFDSILGYLSLPREKGGMGRQDVDGLKGTELNHLLDGTVCPSFAFHVQDTIFAPDPPHGYEPVHRAINGGKMDGFAQSYADEHRPGFAYRIMGYHTAANVPVYDALARDFAIGHRWFASHPGPTFCNRFYELTGRLNVDPNGFWEYDNSSPVRPVFTSTIFDYLTAQEVSWKYFEHHYCFLRFFEKHTFDSENIVAFDDPELGFISLAKNGNLPSVSFIDPHFIELPPGANSDGPPADVKEGQQLVQQVVNAVVTSPQWNKTLLVIIYDEHGGFYDHVPPPAATKVSPESLGTYGVRVPAFVISPWVKGGTVFGHDDIGQQNLYFDHTSILKTIARRFLSQNPPFMGARYAEANDLSSVLGNKLRPSQFLPFIPYNFVYGASQKRLEVQGGEVTPGAILVQDNPNDTIAQQFSFEDAGGGYYYIRTHTGSLYLTAKNSRSVKQDLKYPTHGRATAANNPDRQLWKFTSNGTTVLDRNSFTIWNKAFPGKVLQPSGGSIKSGIPVVLGKPQATHGGVVRTPNAWQVTSPLVTNGQVNAQP